MGADTMEYRVAALIEVGGEDAKDLRKKQKDTFTIY